MGKYLALLVIFTASILIVIENNFVDAVFTPISHAYNVQKLPSIEDFKSKNQSELVGNLVPHTILRENGEKIQSYWLFSSQSNQFIIILYFEDKTNQLLQHYVPFNSDFFLMKFTSHEGTEPKLIFAERKGVGCMMSFDKLNEFWQGIISGCSGGGADIKNTEKGWAAYITFFESINPPTNDKPFLFSLYYGDIKKTKNGLLEEFDKFSWPDIFEYGKIIPLTDKKAENLKVNSGSLSISDFIYKPRNFLTQGLEKNIFDCADNTVIISSAKTNYSPKNDPVKIDVKVNTDLSYGQIYLKIFDEDENIVYQEIQSISKTKTAFFHFNIDAGIGVYAAQAEFGIDGPKARTTFAIGDTKISDIKNECYFYLLYNEAAQSLDVVAHIEDPSNQPYDQIQIFVDRKGDSNFGLNSDDLSFVVNKKDFGSHQLTNTGGIWDSKDYEKIEGRIVSKGDFYDVFIPVSGVSKNFKFAIEQLDNTGLEVKSTRVPQNGFPILPNNWSNTQPSSVVQEKWAADKWRPDEILVKQNLDVNLILVGDNWKPQLQDKIKRKISSSYKPIVFSELSRVGIEYNYNYNFISASEEINKKTFDFMNTNAQKTNLYGSDDFDKPWGSALWIKKNHTEWVDEDFGRYSVEYRLIDAEQMEKFLYETIIKNEPKLSKENSVNLIFISDDMNEINFLHNYKITKADSVHDTFHNAVGLMGYGGNYNLYFFDLYAAPWDNFFWDESIYDKSLNSYTTSLHDVKTDERYVTLISDHVNNATSLLFNPSYIYDPVYKENYVLDLVLVADPKVGLGTVQVLKEYFINVNKIETQLKELTPYSNWKINLQADKISNPNIPSSLRQAINTKSTIALIEGFPDFGTTDVLSSNNLKKAVVEWASVRESNKFKDFKDVKESSWVIPTIVVVTDAYNDVYIDDYGILGLAPSHPADSSQPCCVFGVTTDDVVWNKKVSVTDLVLHEVGHVLGFMHPFHGLDSSDEFNQHNYFTKWYAGIMAYNTPMHGCGFWYDAHVGGTCGIADTIFTKFDKANHARGVTTYLIKVAESNIYMSMLELENNGQDLSKLPDSTKKIIDNVQSKLNKAKTSFLLNHIFSESGAYKLALDAATESTKLVKATDVTVETQTPQIKISIPQWIKDNIKWWSTGAISEKEFVGALQYLIKEKVIVLPEIPESKSTVSEKAVPDWVKNNAIWWSDDKISDIDFVSGIQFLIKEGIIRIE